MKLPSRRLRIRGKSRNLETLEPRQLLAGDLVNHWLVQDLVGTLNDGDTATAWVDRVASVEGSAEGTPVFAEEGMGSRAAFQFDASDGLDLFRISAPQHAVAGADDFSIVVVFSTDSSSHRDGANWFDQSGLVDANTLGWGADWGVSINSSGQLTAGIGERLGVPPTNVGSSASALNNGAMHVAYFTRSGATISLSVDGSAFASRSDGNTALRDTGTDMAIGALQGRTGGFHGAISEVRIYDGALDSAEVASLQSQLESYYNNQPPVATVDTYTTAEDVLLAATNDGLLSNDTDPDGDMLTAELVSGPSHGSLGLNPDGTFVYVPELNFNGTDTFTYVAKDFRASEPTLVTINVTPGYDPIDPRPDEYSGVPTEPITVFGLIGIMANDINVDRLPTTAELVTDVSNGSLSLNPDGGFVYDPQGFSGTETFQYRVNDGIGVSRSETVTLIINTAPIANDDTFTVDEDTVLQRNATLGVTSNDIDADGNALTVELVADVQHGTLTLNDNGAFVYTPAVDYFGSDSFQYRVTDGVDISNVATVNLTVSPVNDAPVGVADVYFGVVDATISASIAEGVINNDIDIDSTNLTAALVAGPSNGTLNLAADGSFTYQPNAGYDGTDLFTYRVSDGEATSEPIEVKLFVGGSPLVISEFMAANRGEIETRVRATPDDNFSGEDLTPDWIEIQNLSSGDFNLGGFHLSNDRNMPTQWAFPEGTIVPGSGYLVVYAGDFSVVDPALDETGRLHADFKLSLEGEYLALVDPNGAVLDDFGNTYDAQVPGVSYGRDLDGELSYLIEATPGAANSSSYLGTTQDTSFSVDRGMYSAPIQVEIATPEPLETIYYSFDGSVPTPESGMRYAGPITIDRTTTLRAASYRDGFLTPNVDTQTYLFLGDVAQQSEAPVTGPTTDPVTFPERWRNLPADYEMDPEVLAEYADRIDEALTALPSLSITLDQENIFGSNGLYSNPSRTTEEATSAELIFPDGTSGFQIDAGLRMQGGASRNPEHKKHSLSLRFREDYGNSVLDYPLFEESSVSEFSSIHLRARYNNSWIHWDQGQRNRGTLIREMWMRDTMLAAGEADAGHGRYVHVYLNGVYWGVYEMHERQDASHYAAYNGGDAYMYDATNANAAVDGNNRRPHQNLQQVVETKDWNAIQEVLDVDNHIRYTILNEFGGNQDLKNDGNWRSAGGGIAEEPWSFFVWDAERILENVRQFGTSPVSDLLGLSADLRDVEEYRIRFADHLHDLLFNDGALTPEQNQARFAKRMDELEVALVAESARWGDLKQRSPLTLDDEWVAETSRIMNDYFPDRTANVLANFRTRTNLYPATDAPEFLVDGERQHGGQLGDGVLTVLNPNGADGIVYYTTDGSDPRLEGGAVNPNAIVYSEAPIGLEGSTLVRMRILNDGEWSAMSQAEFLVEVPADSTNLRITEVNYHPHNAETQRGEPAVDDREFEFLELQNISNSPINLAGVRFVQTNVDGSAEGIDFDFAQQILQPGQSTIVVRNREAFAARYETPTSVIPYALRADTGAGPEGQWSGGQLGNGGEQITLLAADGGVIQQFSYSDGGLWPQRADGVGSTLQLIDVHGDPNSAANWQASFAFGGTPGTANVINTAEVVVNEVLSNSDVPLVDQIELANLTANPIDISHWFLSDASGELRKFQVPSDTSIPGNGYLVLDQNQLGFGLNGGDTDQVYVMVGAADGTIIGFADDVEFEATEANRSLGRWPNGTGQLFAQSTHSLGSANTGPLLPIVSLSEIHYNPASAADGVDPDLLEFIELQNRSATTQDISGWRLDKASDFVFPAGTQLSAGETLVVVPFDPLTNAAALADFRTRYNIGVEVSIAGPYSGTLDNGGERVELQRPADGDDTGFVLIDRVRYDDDAPWPGAADGQGASLNRQPDSYGDLVSSWFTATPTPGSASEPTSTDLDGDGLTNAADIDHLCAQVDLGAAASDLNQDGSVDFADVEFYVINMLGSLFGDTNLDGTFNSSDLVLPFARGEFEDGIANNSGWEDGDWNCDGEFDTSDLVFVFQRGGYSSAASPAALSNAADGAEKGNGIGELDLIAAAILDTDSARRSDRSTHNDRATEDERSQPSEKRQVLDAQHVDALFR